MRLTAVSLPLKCLRDSISSRKPAEDAEKVAIKRYIAQPIHIQTVITSPFEINLKKNLFSTLEFVIRKIYAFHMLKYMLSIGIHNCYPNFRFL